MNGNTVGMNSDFRNRPVIKLQDKFDENRIQENDDFQVQVVVFTI